MGCGEPMEAVSYISKLRVMAVQADPPEITPGERTTLSVLWGDPEGEGREVSFVWIVLPGSFSPDSSLPDIEEEDIPFFYFHVGTSATDGPIFRIPPIPTDILDTRPPDETRDEDEEKLGIKSMGATAVLSVCADGERPDADELEEMFGNDEASDMAGIGDLDLDALCKGGEHVVTFKTFRISDADEDNPNRNTNPELTEFVFNGEILDEDSDETPQLPNIYQCKNTANCLEGADVEANMTDESFQKYDNIEFKKVVEKDEAPYISWFADGGDLQNSHSRTVEPPGPFENVWAPPLDGGEFTLWVVAHDLRGGTSWKRFRIGAETTMTH